MYSEQQLLIDKCNMQQGFVHDTSAVTTATAKN